MKAIRTANDSVIGSSYAYNGISCGTKHNYIFLQKLSICTKRLLFFVIIALNHIEINLLFKSVFHNVGSVTHCPSISW